MAFRSFLALFVSGAAALAAPLDPLFTNPTLWTMAQSEFDIATRGMGFEWTSAAKDSARSARRETTIFGQPAVETIARFESDELKEITVTIYARGDAGHINKEQYDLLVKGSVEAISRATATKFIPRGKDASNAVKADGVLWKTADAQYLLEYSATREVKSRDIPFRAEFVRLEITPAVKAAGLATATVRLTNTRFNPREHVKKDAASGDVVIADVPMVDQGQKGYCVVASAERVMRYYGAQVDSNELAQIANSDAANGTSTEAMYFALKKVSARLKVRVRAVEEMQSKDWSELIKDYNRSAKKAGAPEIPESARDLGMILHSMDYETLKQTRLKSRADYGRYQRDIQQYVELGVPLMWTVQLGMFKEKGIPQTAGGHMRLIIGYNLKTREVIYTDSWGAGHEQKRMPMEDAYAITNGLAAIEPT